MGLDASKAVERSVDSVSRIYAVVIGLALSQSVQTLITKNATGGADLQVNSLVGGAPAFVALLFTLVPFWHGMNRHLDRCYLSKDGEVAQGALILDFGVFFIEAVLLFVTGWSLRSGLVRFFCLGALLIVDTLWGFVSHQIHFSGRHSHVVGWAVINMIAVIAAVLVIAFPFEHKPFVLMTIAIARSIVDYWRGWNFYFPVPPSVETSPGCAQQQSI